MHSSGAKFKTQCRSAREINWPVEAHINLLSSCEIQRKFEIEKPFFLPLSLIEEEEEEEKNRE